MRKFLLLLIVIFATTVFVASGVDARTYTKKHYRHRTHAVRMTRHKARSCKTVKRVVCRPVRHVRHVRRAPIGSGPVIRPVVNVPAPAVTCPNPQVHVAAPNVTFPPLNVPTVGITVDDCNIYIVRENELLVLGKTDMCLKRRVPLNPPPSAPSE